MLMTWILPACFSIVWMSVFGATSLSFETTGVVDLSTPLNSLGAESVIYKIFEQLPWSSFVIPVFILAVFVSYTTAADSNLLAISGLCSFGGQYKNTIKVIFGVLLGTTSLLMVNQ